ncbi:MAG: citrate synthase [Proteobacteria bacterium]|nr:citrate synthase [Pseudomonadota bacterium]
MGTHPPRPNGEWLSADQAASQLGVRKATLYAYVSRGLLTAVADPQQPRCRRYPALEVEGLREGLRRHRPPASPGMLYEGHPLVDTALTGMVDGVLVMGGQPLTTWAEHASVEDTAALLWHTSVAAAFGDPPPVLPALWHRTAADLREADPQCRAMALWSLALPHLRGDLSLQGDALAAALGAHLRVAFACYLGQAPSDDPLHLQVAHAWAITVPHHDAVRQSLVLCADILGNLMSLSGRMLASLQGSLAACLTATMSYGFVRLSGGEYEAVETLFDTVLESGNPASVAAAYRSRGETLPGFNHHAFVHGDPRAAALLRMADTLGSPAAHWIPLMQGSHLQHPALDWSLVALRRALGAPRHAAFSLMHMARSTGMLAQVVEQRQIDQRMWVTSRYVGPSPSRDNPPP